MGQRHRQAAVIPYRVQGRHLEIALVRTSSGTGWIVPKGSLDKGECASDAAVRETEEEAGLTGELTRHPIGQYRYSKRDQQYEVDVYAMRVTTILEFWLEAAHRSRQWVAVEDALERLHPELHGFVHETVRMARSVGQPRGKATGRSRPRVSLPRSL
jgi:8-oxo-dGTP pyrophosphatase MutT (NUDIX family)